MSSNQELHARRQAAVPRGVSSATEIFAAKADNAELWDVEGKRYIDFAGGIGVLNTGHRHPKVMAAIQHSSNASRIPAFQVTPYEPYVELAEKLNQLAPCAGPEQDHLPHHRVPRRSRMRSRSRAPRPSALR